MNDTPFEPKPLSKALKDLGEMTKEELKDLGKVSEEEWQEEYLRAAQRIDSLQTLQRATIYYKRALQGWGARTFNAQHAATPSDDQKVFETQKEFEEALKPFLEDWLKEMVKHFSKHTNPGGYSIGGSVLSPPKEKP